MSNEQLPIIRQMHDAADDRARADILLRCPDAVLLKYYEVFCAACTRAKFQLGLDYLASRLGPLLAVRDAHGFLPSEMEATASAVRQDMALLTAGTAQPPAA